MGTYKYPEVPKDIYKRHRYCRCTVEFLPGDGRRQNVHTKKWLDPEKEEKLQERINYKAKTAYKHANEAIADDLELKSQGWYSSLSYHEKEALADYTDTHYIRINKYLRGEDMSDYVEYANWEQDIKTHIENLDSALDKYELEENISFYRGIGKEEIEYIENNKVFLEYKSLTTAEKEIAEDFIYDQPGGEVVLFNIKKGTKGAYIGTNSYNPGEREYILKRNQKYKWRRVNGRLEVTIE